MTVVLFIIIGMMGYAIFFLYDAFCEKCMECNKMKRNLLMLYDWMDLERTGTGVVASLLLKSGYQEIIIYGWGYLGNRLYRELENTPVKVKGILDRRSINNVYDVPSYTLQSEMPKSDAIIITILYDTEKIRSDVEKVAGCPILGLEELIEYGKRES